MINLIFNLSKLLLFSLYSKKKYDYTNTINYRDLKIINKYINNCGCICIKCVQWLLPLLEKNNIDKSIIDILNNVYETNIIHDIKYTEKKYREHFKNELKNEYYIIDIIGSGSIGQVYKVKNIKTSQYQVMKVMHPGIQNQMIFFKRIFRFIYDSKIFDKFLYKYFPFNLVEFMSDFHKQSDFINECNNLLDFYHNYKDNEYIIIPELIRASNDIIIMEYVEGKCIEDTDMNEYDKSKVIFLLYLFIRNNMLILNNIHGDLHKYNWKVSDSKLKNVHKIIIYDFGYCFKNNKEEYDNLINICSLIISYDKNNPSKVKKYKEFVEFIFNRKEILFDMDLDHNITKPEILLNNILGISQINNVIINRHKVLNILLLMCLIDNYLTKYNLSNEPKDEISNKLINAYSFCNYHNIFNELSETLLNEYKSLDYKEILFDDKIKSLI